MQSTRKESSKQEKYLAKMLGGKVTPNSGGTKFSGGDVIAEPFLIEAKTVMKPQKSFSVKKDWIDKVFEQAFEQGMDSGVVAFQFEPDGENYFILTEKQFKEYYDHIQEEYYGNF